MVRRAMATTDQRADTNEPGLKCPACGSAETEVIETRDTVDGIRRRRQCLTCGDRFPTREYLTNRRGVRVGDSAPSKAYIASRTRASAAVLRLDKADKLEQWDDVIEHALAIIHEASRLLLMRDDV